jgi:uncharacterized protein involved in high-affinity Fe2+ transport
VTSPATDPPARPSNEATTDQLTVARREGDAYADALHAMADEDGAVVTRAGDYLIAFVNEEAEGMYERDGDRLVWREAAPEATTHLEVAVADGADGRFVPGLTVHVDVEQDDHTLVYADLPFLWHPFLYHYGSNAKLPGTGPYDVTIRIDAPDFMRHDPINGRRYADTVTARLKKITFTNGRKESPDAQPRGADAPTAGDAGDRR